MKNIVDIFFLIGVLLIIVPTFIINILIGCYLLGVILILVTGYIAKNQDNK